MKTSKLKVCSLSEAPSKTVRFRAFRDEEAGVWIATSDADRITTEAGTKQDVIDRLAVIVSDVLESRNAREGRVAITIDWQELRTVDQTAFALA